MGIQQLGDLRNYQFLPNKIRYSYQLGCGLALSGWHWHSRRQQWAGSMVFALHSCTRRRGIKEPCLRMAKNPTRVVRALRVCARELAGSGPWTRSAQRRTHHE